MEVINLFQEVKGFNEAQLAQLREVARFAEDRYSELPYHNWAHAARDTFNEAMRLSDLCDENGVSVDRFRVAMSALCHDISYDEPVPHFLSSKEEHSAYLTAIFLQSIGVSFDTTEGVIKDILATQCGNSCEDIESKIIRRADLANVGGGYTTFTRNTLLLILESARLNRSPFDPKNLRSTLDMSCQILGTYVKDDLSLGGFDSEYRNRFLPNALSNIRLLGEETSTSLRSKFVELWTRATTEQDAS